MSVGTLLTKIIYKLANGAVGRYWQLRYSAYRHKYDLADDLVFNGPDIRFYGEGHLVIGRRSHIGSYSTIQVKQGCSVSIDENCRISHNVRMYTSSHWANQDFSEAVLRHKTGDITIGKHVWIGVNVYIGPGITIGENAVVGANTVVTKDVPAGAIAGGVPAKVIMSKDL